MLLPCLHTETATVLNLFWVRELSEEEKEKKKRKNVQVSFLTAHTPWCIGPYFLKTLRALWIWATPFDFVSSGNCTRYGR